MKGIICFSIALLSYFYYKVNTPLVELYQQPTAAEKVVKKPTMITAAVLNAFAMASAHDKKVCIHEAGHFLIFALNGLQVTELSCIQTEKWGGYCQAEKREDGHADDVACAGGYASEIVFVSHEKTVFDYFYRKGYNKHTVTDTQDLSAQIRNDPQEAYDLVVEAAKMLQGKLPQITAIAAVLYQKKKLGKAECADLQAEILNN